MSGLRNLLPNAWYVAVREYKSRVGSRSFVVGTVILAAIAFAAAEAPVLVDALVSSSQTKLAVVVEPAARNMPSDGRVLLELGLNGSDKNSTKSRFALTWSDDRAAAMKALKDGTYEAVLVIDRTSSSASGSPDLSFVLRTDMAADGQSIQAIKAAVQSLVIEDRLAPRGSSIAQVTAAYPFDLQAATAGKKSIANDISTNLMSTFLIVLIFMAIITYGTWVAMSVAEEKGSRVMELMLNAATPLQMLAGKVVGNGGAGLTQYAVILGAAVVGVLSQKRVQQLITGGTNDGSSFAGLTPAMVAGFLVLFVLGFAFYSLLYAGLGSLVSRQEDVQSATSPLMVLVMIGYFLSVFALNAINETWVQVLSFVPFFTPYLMLARIAMGEVALWEIGLAVVILTASIAVALAIAARIYSAGVLLYGQRVGLREIFKAARVSR